MIILTILGIICAIIVLIPFLIFLVFQLVLFAWYFLFERKENKCLEKK
jgi:4-amino-4-deoxy-L-arabinose transferase-like glycosyltransferase